MPPSFSSDVKKEILQGDLFKKPCCSEVGANTSANQLPKKNCCKRTLLASVLLSAGYIGDPKTSYHAEFRAKDENHAKELSKLFHSFGLTPHTAYIKDRQAARLYFKDGEQIGEILKITGAHENFIRFENERILRSVGNKINRNANFEAANVDKSIFAAVKQIEYLKQIEGGPGLSSLPKNLRELAEIRQKHPEMSLAEIGASLHPPISKSAVNHRLRKIKEIASQIGEEQNDTERT